ncbi:MAG: PLP-dependent cysteine synthase family protein [Candidatus Paceibacterota bacterium]
MENGTNKITDIFPEDLIGNTPLVRSSKMFPNSKVYIKPEWLNPGGSIKDRIALHLVNQAEQSNLIKKGGTIVEPTSGNTGAGLALVAAQRGYKCIFTCSDKVSEEKVALLRSLGAEVIITSSLLSTSDEGSYISLARSIANKTPNAWMPDQYHSDDNPKAHEISTGPEIWEQTKGRVTHVLATTGTGGTLTGLATFFKKINPSVKIIGVDPEGSVYSGSEPKPYLTEGPGKDELPPFWQKGLVDEIYVISDEEAFSCARKFSKMEGMLIGGSSGMVLAAVEKLLSAEPQALVVAVLPDSGRAYMSKIYNDKWMLTNGFSTDSCNVDYSENLSINKLRSATDLKGCVEILNAGETLVALTKGGAPRSVIEIEKLCRKDGLGSVVTEPIKPVGVYDPGILIRSENEYRLVVKNGRILGYIN